MTQKKKQRPSSKIIPGYFPPQQPCWESTVDTCFRKRSPRRSVHARLLLEPQYSRGKPPGQRGTKVILSMWKKWQETVDLRIIPICIHMYTWIAYFFAFVDFKHPRSMQYIDIRPNPFLRKGIRSLWRIKTVKFKSALFSLKLAFVQIQGLFA